MSRNVGESQPGASMASLICGVNMHLQLAARRLRPHGVAAGIAREPQHTERHEPRLPPTPEKTFCVLESGRVASCARACAWVCACRPPHPDPDHAFEHDQNRRPRRQRRRIVSGSLSMVASSWRARVCTWAWRASIDYRTRIDYRTWEWRRGAPSSSAAERRRRRHRPRRHLRGRRATL
jgi:hypothetical protein